MLLKHITQRGDRLAVEAGRIVLTPKSGKQAAADEWLSDHHDQLLSEIVEATGKAAFVYHGYSAGAYGKHKAGGVNLQLTNVATGEQAYCIFNVDVRRSRTSKHGKKGSRLPDDHFNPPKGGEFLKFWKRCGLPLPRRLSAFHDYMGKLGSVILTAPASLTEKVDKQALRPLEVTYEEVLKAVGLPPGAGQKLPDNFRTSPGQLPDNCRTSVPDKETLKPASLLGLQANLGTGQNQYGKRLHGNTVTRHAPMPEERGIDEWLADYDRAAANTR